MKNNKPRKMMMMSFLAILAILFAACSDDSGIKYPEPDLEGNPIDGRAYAETPQLNYVLEGSTSESVSNIDVTGTSTNPEFKDFRLTQSHITYVNLSDESIRIGDGEFLLDGQNGNTIYGVYSGTGSLEKGVLTANLDLEIKGGAGICASVAYGTIHETIELSHILDNENRRIGIDINFMGVYCLPIE